MNRQIIRLGRLPNKPEYRDFDPVKNGANLLDRCRTLGFTNPETPLCVYQDRDKVSYLTGEDITKYCCFIVRLINPDTTATDAALALISTHFLRVYTCDLLHEAGKDGPYTPSCACVWLSNCFEVTSATQSASRRCTLKRSPANMTTLSRS